MTLKLSQNEKVERKQLLAREYRERNRDKKNLYDREYREKNGLNITYVCECGGRAMKRNISHHRKTKKHITYLKYQDEIKK